MMARSRAFGSAFFFLVSWLGFPFTVLANIAVIDLQSNMTVKTFADLQAAFGPDFPKNGMEGRVVVANPKNACSPIAQAPAYKDQYNWIVMIIRGGKCEFADKIIAAQQANFSAAIVHNYDYWEGLTTMGGGANGSKVTIPSTFVGYSTGMKLIRYSQENDYIVEIKEEEDIDYRMYLWPFAIVVGACFFMIILFLGIRFARDHIRTTVSRLSKKHLKKIPIRKFKKGQYYDTCAICLDEYEDGEKIRILPCDHAYHTKCIDPWLTQNKKTCPVCKRRVIPGKDPNSDSDSDDYGSSMERRPLLRATSQASHGSINRSSSHDPTDLPIQSSESMDETQGAVGGVNTSSQISCQVRVQVEHEVNGGEQREARRPRKERQERSDGSSNQAEDAPEDRKAERREKRKRKKEKKREGRRARRLEAPVDNHFGEQYSQLNVVEAEHQDEDSDTVVEGDVESCPPDYTTAPEAPAAGSDEAAAEGYINPSYSESQEVVMPNTGKKREMNEVV